MGKIVIRNGSNHLDLVSRGKRTINSATQNKVILSDDSVTIRVQSNSVLDIKINDTFEVYGDVYRINQMPSVTKYNEMSYEYDIVGQGLMFDLLRCKFFNADGTGVKTTRDFPLTGTIEVFLLALKANMQRLSADWEIGTYLNAETKTITFSDDTCLSALQKICQEFKTEFWVKAEGGKFKIHTGNFGSTLPQTLQYGKGKGLYNLSRKNVNENGIINRLYVDGGTQNIPANYRGFSDRLKFSDAGYIEDAALIAEHGLKEGSIVFDDIYPHRTGVISAVNGVFKFSDASMDFDLNEKEADGITTKYLVAGQTAKVHFNTGNLAGYEFEIKSYNHATKEFEIIQFDNQNGQKFPDTNSAAFQFAVGDEYVLLDIVMPQTYITNAETQLQTKGNEQFALLKQAKVSYDLNVAEDFLKTLAIPLQIGDMVRVVDLALGIDKTLRVNQITRNFIQNGEVKDYDYKIVIADAYEIAQSSKFALEIVKVKTIIDRQDQNQYWLGKKISAEEARVIELENKTDFLTETAIENNAVATGSLIVGNGTGANAGITGIGDTDAVRFWAGASFAGRETANWLMRENGIEEQWILYNGAIKLLRRRGFINGNYYDDLYNPANDTLAKRTAVINGFITEQWYNNGILVYEVGKNGIYYVSEVPESYAVSLMKEVSSISEAPDELALDFCKDGIYINQKTQWNSYSSYLYSAGQNAYSESNKQYEGYKTTDGNKYISIPDGTYVLNGANWTHDSTNVYVPVVTITGGKITNQTHVTIPKSGIPICN